MSSFYTDRKAALINEGIVPRTVFPPAEHRIIRYPLTKHGTNSSVSILFSQEEHTPWWIGPSPSVGKNNPTERTVAKIAAPSKNKEEVQNLLQFDW